MSRNSNQQQPLQEDRSDQGRTLQGLRKASEEEKLSCDQFADSNIGDIMLDLTFTFPYRGFQRTKGFEGDKEQ